MKKILIFFFSLTLSSSVFAIKNQKEDPCSELQGKWHGSWTISYCQWKAELDGTLYEKTARLVGWVHDSQYPEYCPDQLVSLTGTCENGYLVFDDLKGNVFENVLTLQSNTTGAYVILKKNDSSSS